MWYVFNAKDKKGSLDKRLQYRPLHLARLELLISEGRLLIAGAYPAIDNIEPGAAGFQGSLLPRRPIRGSSKFCRPRGLETRSRVRSLGAHSPHAA